MNNTIFAPTREGRIYTGVAEELERVPEKFRPDMALRIMRLLSGSVTLEEAADGLEWGAYNWLSRIADEADISENRREHNSERGARGGRPKVDREEAAKMKAAGATDKEIAEALGCTVRTVERITAETRQNTTKPDKSKNKSVNVNSNVGCVGVASGSPATPYMETGKPLTPEQIDAMLQAKTTSPGRPEKGV